MAKVEAAEWMNDSIRNSFPKITRAIGAQSETTSTPPSTPSSISHESAISTKFLKGETSRNELVPF